MKRLRTKVLSTWKFAGTQPRESGHRLQHGGYKYHQCECAIVRNFLEFVALANILIESHDSQDRLPYCF